MKMKRKAAAWRLTSRSRLALTARENPLAPYQQTLSNTHLSEHISNSNALSSRVLYPELDNVCAARRCSHPLARSLCLPQLLGTV